MSVSNQTIHPEDITRFLVDDGYSEDILPMVCTLSGSRPYGLSVKSSDRDYLGIHLMNSWDCLEHPDFRPKLQVIRKRFNFTDSDGLIEVPQGVKGGDISLDSFEMWKFISLYLKGSFVTHELLYMPPGHLDPESAQLFSLMRSGITNRIGRVARGNCLHDWAKHRNERKRAVLASYRLIQAIYFLREREFEWDITNLLSYIKPAGVVDAIPTLVSQYMDEEQRKSRLDEKEVAAVSSDMEKLIDEVDRAMVTTKLPDQTPRQILDEILQKVKKTRSVMI